MDIFLFPFYCICKQYYLPLYHQKGNKVITTKNKDYETVFCKR